MLIRTANTNDLENICWLAEEISSSHHEKAPHVFAPSPGIERDREHWNAVITSENSTMLVAEEDREIVGFISAKIMATSSTFLQPRIICHIGTLVVAQRRHRTGIGERLLFTVEKWAADQSATEIKLEVFDFNKGAIQFYAADGYSTQSHIMTKTIL